MISPQPDLSQASAAETDPGECSHWPAGPAATATSQPFGQHMSHDRHHAPRSPGGMFRGGEDPFAGSIADHRAEVQGPAGFWPPAGAAVTAVALGAGRVRVG